MRWGRGGRKEVEGERERGGGRREKCLYTSLLFILTGEFYLTFTGILEVQAKKKTNLVYYA